jgi:hypothetical protein
MLERLKDKVPEIRSQAVTALQRLQDPKDDECPIIKVRKKIGKALSSVLEKTLSGKLEDPQNSYKACKLGILLYTIFSS